MGCAISPILFIGTLEIMPIGARKVVRGPSIPLDERLPPLRSYMDVTSILQTAPCIARLLKHLSELMTLAKMKIKPSKPQSLSIGKGVRNDRTVFVTGGEEIPWLVEQLL